MIPCGVWRPCREKILIRHAQTCVIPRTPRQWAGLLCISPINRNVNEFPAGRAAVGAFARRASARPYELWRFAIIASPIVAVGDDLADRNVSISWRSAC